MKLVTLLVSLPLLIAGAAAAGPAREACLKEEKELRAQEKERCGGFRYFLDPSGCFSTQRALKEYDGGKCREIGSPEKAPASSPPAPPSEPKPAPVPAPEPPLAAMGETPAPTAPEEEPARLKAENARLRTEIERLKAEIERLRR